MKLGMIGLGHMGYALASRVAIAGHEVVGYDLDAHACQRAQELGVTIKDSPAAVAQAFQNERRIIWLMVPAGAPVDDALVALQPRKGDIIIDGGNSRWTDSVSRAQKLAAQGVAFLDCGVSGGLQAQDLGFSLMVGGDREAYQTILPLLQVLAAQQGFAHVGPSGAGHYVKMIHNGIEYGLLQAYAEGLQLVHESSTYKDLDVQQVVAVWQHGSIIRSWVLDLAAQALQQESALQQTTGAIAEGGTGRWAAHEAEKNKIPVPVLQAALGVRERSRHGAVSWATKLIVLIRSVFGGHRV